jgi:hypothetical protein
MSQQKPQTLPCRLATSVPPPRLRTASSSQMATAEEVRIEAPSL